MSRSKSKEKLKTPQEELEELKKKLSALEGERKALFESSNLTLHQNRENIAQLQKEHKELRSELRSQTKQYASTSGKPKGDEFQESIKLRRRLDQLKGTYTQKQKQFKDMQDKLKEMTAEQKGSMMNEDAPLMRQIRILENRLDKAMIKYNEAQSIKKTYEQIVKQLKEERVAYDNQLAAIEKSLKGKEQDFEELLLLRHDANHAKETSEAELLRFEAQVTIERMTRKKNVEEKKDEVKERVEMTQQLEANEQLGQESQTKEQIQSPGFYKETSKEELFKEEKQKVKSYEEAFRKIKEATGVSDVNEIIQKFTTQEETARNLENLQKEYQEKLEYLSEQKTHLQQRVHSLKFSSSNETESRKQLDDLESDINLATANYEKTKEKYERVMDHFINIKAGIEHIAELLESYKLPSQPNIQVSDETLFEAVEQCQHKLRMVYTEIKSTEVFKLLEKEGTKLSKPTDTAERTSALLKTIYSVPELSEAAFNLEKSNAYNCRVKLDKEEDTFAEDALEEELENTTERERVRRETRFDKLAKINPKRIKSASMQRRRNP